MNDLVALFLVLAGAAQLLLPRRFAAIPMLMTFAWIPRAQALDVGDLKITAFRVIVCIALVRIFVRREKLASGFLAIDLAWLLWSLAMLATWALHTSNDFAFRGGLVWEYLGTYMLVRVVLRDYKDIERLFAAFTLVLLPVALSMLIERQTGENPLGSIGGLTTQFREGNFRAAGSFAHPILAGAVGATSLLMGLSMLRRHVFTGVLAVLSGTAIVYAAASSGPIMMAAVGVCGLALWRYRMHLTAIRCAMLLFALLLQLVMQDPIYYLMAKIDVVGGSTGWHRSRLIQATVEHFDEWWLAGTDRTIHWMPTGIIANDQHTDLTNHLIAMGVMGGLPLLIPFCAALYLLVRHVDRAVTSAALSDRNRFIAWSVGAIAFAHVANFLTAHLFDQSIVAFMLLFACAGVLRQVPPCALPAGAPERARRPDPYAAAAHNFW
jgi:hypothetical protein